MKKILNGNEAFAMGALSAGVNFFAGYPITPSTDVYEFFMKEHDKYGVKFISATSEISAINLCFGASVAGGRALTATSGCGFSLMQEAISYMASDFVPCVILNVMREGAGLGDINRSQGDIFQMTKGGGNGDYHSIVLSCSSVRDCIDMPEIAFMLAEKYRTPVIVTYDSDIAHIKENVEIKEIKTHNIDSNFALVGSKDNPKRIQNIYYHDKNYDETLKNKYEMIEKNEMRYRSYKTDDADIVFVAISICERICMEAVNVLRSMGIKAGIITPITLYPFPKVAFNNLKEDTKIVVVELNILKQLRMDVEYFTKFKYKYYSINHMSKCPTVKEIVEYVKEI